MADEEELNIINIGDPTHVSFPTRTEKAIDVTMITPKLNEEVEWHVHCDTCGSYHYSTICRFIESNPQATRRTAWKLKTFAKHGRNETLSIKEITKTIFETIPKYEEN
jgi:hypothetical protein